MIKEKKFLYSFSIFLFLFCIFFTGILNVCASEIYEDLGNLNDKTTFYVIYPGSSSPVSMPIGQEWNFESYDIDGFIINIDNFEFKKNNTYEITLTLPKSIITNANSYTVTASNGNSCSTGFIKDMLTNYPKFSFSCSSDTNSISLNIFNSSGSPIITNKWWFSWTNLNLKRMFSSEEELENTIKNELSTCRDGYNLLQYTTTQNTSLNGLTFIFNEDKSITVNGTATDTTVFSFINGATIYLDGGMYTFSGSTGGSISTYFMEAIIGPSNTYFHSINGSETLSLVDGSYLFRAYIYVANGATLNNVTFKPMFEKGTIAHSYESYSKDKICTNKIDETNDKLNDLNNSLNDDNTSGATNDASNFFSNFTTDTFGLTSIITSPLSLINSLTSKSCSTLNLPLPYLDDEYLTLPCMETIYSKYFGGFFDIYQVITFGIVSYWVIVRIFNQVKDFKNPEHDEIEVVDL